MKTPGQNWTSPQRLRHSASTHSEAGYIQSHLAAERGIIMCSPSIGIKDFYDKLKGTDLLIFKFLLQQHEYKVYV